MAFTSTRCLKKMICPGLTRTHFSPHAPRIAWCLWLEPPPQFELLHNKHGPAFSRTHHVKARSNPRDVPSANGSNWPSPDPNQLAGQTPHLCTQSAVGRVQSSKLDHRRRWIGVNLKLILLCLDFSCVDQRLQLPTRCEVIIQV